MTALSLSPRLLLTQTAKPLSFPSMLHFSNNKRTLLTFYCFRSTNEIDKDTVATITQLEFISKELKQVVCTWLLYYMYELCLTVQLSRGTGQPTCVAVGKYMAVGLSTGTVLVFGKSVDPQWHILNGVFYFLFQI